MHERIGLVRSVNAGEHHLTIQFLSDVDSRVERGIGFIWPPALTVIQAAQLEAVSNAIVAALTAARIQVEPTLPRPVQFQLPSTAGWPQRHQQSAGQRTMSLEAAALTGPVT